MQSAEATIKYTATPAQRRQHLQELSSLEDIDGQKYRFAMYRGVTVSPFPGVRRRLADYEANFKPRDSDVFICAYVKSGTHWVNEMAHMILRKTSERPQPKEEFMLERVDREKIDGLPNPRLLNSHLRFSLLPKSIFGKAKFIFVTRDVRDVAVSLYHHVRSREANNPSFYQPSWPAFIDLFTKGLMENGDWFEYIKEWHNSWLGAKRADTLVLHYELIKQQPRETLLQLAQFLLPAAEAEQLTPEFIDAVLSKTAFASMQRDRSEDVTIKMYRKGEVGDWKNHFTELDHFNLKSQMFDSLTAQDKKLFLKYSSISDWS